MNCDVVGDASRVMASLEERGLDEQERVFTFESLAAACCGRPGQLLEL